MPSPADSTSQAPRPTWPADWLVPTWQDDEVGALMTSRRGGVSAPPWDSMNLGDHVGDERASVDANRARFASLLEARPVYLRQVHGTRVVQLDAADLAPNAPVHEADACISREPGLACTILVADCLPVLLAAPGTRGVGAAHAGWRGLAAGVLEATAHSLCALAGCSPGELRAWIGVGIGPARFEIGDEVVRALGGDPVHPTGAFGQTIDAQGRERWCADLPALARTRLQRLGLTQVELAARCSAGESSSFFSYRRDGVTGRMAAAVWIRGHRA